MGPGGAERGVRMDRALRGPGPLLDAGEGLHPSGPAVRSTGHLRALGAATLAPTPPPRPLFSGWLILYPGGGGSEAKKKFVYLKSTSKFGPLR